MINGNTILDMPMTKLRDSWEETSFELDKLQATPSCVFEEQNGLAGRHAPKYEVSFHQDEQSLCKSINIFLVSMFS